MIRSRSNIFLCIIFLLTAACSQEISSAPTPMQNQQADKPQQQMPPPPSPVLAEEYEYTASYAPSDTARYEQYADNPVKQTIKEPLSTFSLNVGTASYANTRRFLQSGHLPNPDAVRLEELLNYFPQAENEQLEPLGKSPFNADYKLAPSPWDENKVLLYLHLKANDLTNRKMPPANFVFLVDVSGSMGYDNNRLPLVKEVLKGFLKELSAQDKVSIVTYSGNVEVALEPTPAENNAAIRSAISRLDAGGGTAGGPGLMLAYEQAEKSFIKGGINRIILCTDGDFNLGVASDEELENIVSGKRDKGITLSVLGFGGYNLNDGMMMKIADSGNGNHSYIDNMAEGRKVLGEEMRATLVTVAKDVKVQIEFNPAQVIEYRQIGYDMRQLAAEDFNNDKVDAGEIGAGKDVVALYELTLAGGKPSVDPLRYQENAPTPAGNSSELAFLKVRWKPGKALEQTDIPSQLASLPILKSAIAPSFDQAGENLRFYAAVAAYGQKLRNNPALSQTAWENIATWAENSKGTDQQGYRSEFVKLVKIAASLSGAD